MFAQNFMTDHFFSEPLIDGVGIGRRDSTTSPITHVKEAENSNLYVYPTKNDEDFL